MIKIVWWIMVLVVGMHGADMTPWKTKIEKLSNFEKHVIIDKGTERPWSGKYVNKTDKGIYRCKVCGTALYKSDDKFDSHCGWPSFDDAIPGAIKEQPDADGQRTEIVCSRCGAHLGHLFRGEGLTPKNTRHCVNSVSLSFEKKKTAEKKKATAPREAKAYFAGGCFWGVEYYMEQIPGVLEVTSGFMGGNVKNPGYYDVVRGDTGHLETVEVRYDPSTVDYATLAKRFFEIHDPTQQDGQGPDIGSQYRSAVFVSNDKERKIVERLIGILEKKGLKVATKILPKSDFYQAEAYHQNYYRKKGGTPYCHRRVKRFDD
jgi:peptide methionine sulfoxide reductase msrA/msrB